MTPPLRFLFDYVSPYAYLASTQLRTLASRHGREVSPEPVVFGALLSAHGTRGPAEVPARREYLFRDIVRLARALDVPIEPPASHPFNPLVALRATAVVDDAAARWRLVDALYRAAWVERLAIDTPEVVRRVADAAGFDGARLVESAATPEAKAKLRAGTEEAVAAGVFGVPSVLADGALFWGVDSLPHLARRLAGGGDVSDATLERWRSVTASVVRKGA